MYIKSNILSGGIKQANLSTSRSLMPSDRELMAQKYREMCRERVIACHDWMLWRKWQIYPIKECFDTKQWCGVIYGQFILVGWVRLRGSTKTCRRPALHNGNWTTQLPNTFLTHAFHPIRINNKKFFKARRFQYFRKLQKAQIHCSF